MLQNKRNLAAALALIVVFAAGYVVAQVKNKFAAPKTIIHFVSLKWKAGSAEADRQKALEGIKAMAAEIPGIKNVWIKTVRVQPEEYNAVFAIEFESAQAAEVYRDHPAHKEWEKQYLAIREESRSGQASN